MPRVYKKPHRRRQGVTGHHVMMLMRGHSWFPAFGGEIDLTRSNLQEAREAWQDLRTELLRWHISKCPGSRPYSWWLFDAPGPRQCIEGSHDCPQRQMYTERHGKLSYYGHSSIYACPACWNEQYESQAAFLVRHELLTQAERRIILGDPTAADQWWIARYDDNDTPAVGDLAAFIQRYGGA